MLQIVSRASEADSKTRRKRPSSRRSTFSGSTPPLVRSMRKRSSAAAASGRPETSSALPAVPLKHSPDAKWKKVSSRNSNAAGEPSRSVPASPAPISLRRSRRLVGKGSSICPKQARPLTPLIKALQPLSSSKVR